MPIQRITSFKVHDEKDIAGILEQYKVLAAKNEKDGKPYILEIKARQTISDARNQGYNLVAMTKFKTLQDMKYYDVECEAHQALKKYNHGKISIPPLTMYMLDE
ncbi:hypothetical protein AC579_3187 [Pseudocercospora musae]|uniref:Stress-response A/B barrel domain-containing protein n=1 Tax=Pseudocercospora musae TaxID=113226 RepID=A0A139IRW6_9PEZI|nr:hypothetical protein AC579_3187 [Pseudocercospora musae]